MTDPRLPVPEMDEVRARLVEAARRLDQAERPASAGRRWRRRPVALAAVVLVAGGGAVAVATELISVGEPERDAVSIPQRYRPGSTRPVITARASDRAFPLPWAVAVYDTPQGQRCAVTGQARGSTLGVIRDGKFRPYPATPAATCGKPVAASAALDVRRFTTEPPRAILYGRVGDDIATVRVTVPAGTRTARVGAGGSVLLVFDEIRSMRDVRLELLDRAGVVRNR